MDRELDPVFLAVLSVLEPALSELGFRLVSETHHFASFGSAETEYHRRGVRLRFIWDGKDRWTWLTAAQQPSSAFPRPDTYRDIDFPFVSGNTVAPSLRTPEQGHARGIELVARLTSALVEITSPAV